MIKIEKLSNDAKVFITKNNKTLQIFVGQLVTHSDWQTVDVVSGSVTYSVDEAEVKTLFSPVVDNSMKTADIGSSVSTKDTVVANNTTTTSAKPKINTRNASVKK